LREHAPGRRHPPAREDLARYFAQIAQKPHRRRISRFQVDLNRPRTAPYITLPQDAGVCMCASTRGEAALAEAQALYTGFYLRTRLLLEELCGCSRGCSCFDLHSYNHMRQGPGRPRRRDRQPGDIFGYFEQYLRSGGRSSDDIHARWRRTTILGAAGCAARRQVHRRAILPLAARYLRRGVVAWRWS
jgi:hypothetical protein